MDRIPAIHLYSFAGNDLSILKSKTLTGLVAGTAKNVSSLAVCGLRGGCASQQRGTNGEHAETSTPGHLPTQKTRGDRPQDFGENKASGRRFASYFMNVLLGNTEPRKYGVAASCEDEMGI